MDFHCHVDLFPDAKEVYAEALRRNVFTLLVTTSPRAFAATSKILPPTDRLFVSPGLHPEIADKKAGERDLLLKQIEHCGVVGEVGLDGSPKYALSFGLQKEILRDVLKKSAEMGGRVLSLHSRRAATSVIDLLEKEPGFGTAILHWFSGAPRELERAVELGCWFSVGPAMLLSDSGRRLALMMPTDRVVPESDGPFAKVNASPVMPWDASSVSKKLSTCWKMGDVEASQQLDLNSHRLIALIGRN